MEQKKPSPLWEGEGGNRLRKMGARVKKPPEPQKFGKKLHPEDLVHLFQIVFPHIGDTSDLGSLLGKGDEIITPYAIQGELPSTSYQLPETGSQSIGVGIHSNGTNG